MKELPRISVMPLDENDKKSITDLIKESLADALTTDIKPMLEDYTESTKKSLAEDINKYAATNKRFFDKYANDLSELETKLGKIGESQAPPATPPEAPPATPPASDSGSGDEKYNQILGQLKDLTGKYDESIQQAKKFQQEAQREKLYSSFKDQCRDKCHDADTFLTVLLNSGKVQERDTGLVVKTDRIDLETGNTLYEPVEKHIDRFLKEDYPYLHKPRPGNGGNGFNGGTGQAPPSRKYFPDEKNEAGEKKGHVDATDIYRAIQEGKTEEVMSELNSLSGNS